MLSVTVHITNEDAIVCELEEIPDTKSLFLVLHNPRRRDGKDVHYLDEEVTMMLLPWHRVNFVQLMPSAEGEQVIGFVRE
jgi:hypothetical protein